MTGGSPETGEDALSRLDITVAHSARVWNYLLGGKDHFAADAAHPDAGRAPGTSPPAPAGFPPLFRYHANVPDPGSYGLFLRRLLPQAVDPSIDPPWSSHIPPADLTRTVIPDWPYPLLADCRISATMNVIVQ